MDATDVSITRDMAANRILARHPGAMQLNELYSQDSNTKVQMALTNNTNGRLRITSNSLALGGTSNFLISSSSLVYGMCLNATITPGANNAPQCEGWLFQAIQAVQITIIGSNMSPITVDGGVLREYVLSCCRNREERNTILKNGGKLSPVATQTKATIPIAWMLDSGVGVGKGFPFDTTVFSGGIQVAISFWPSNRFITGTGTGAAAPVATLNVANFDSLTMSFCTTDIPNPAYGMAYALSTEGNIEYSIPGEYFSSVPYRQTVTPGTEVVLNLNSAPQGMLEAIILNIKPTVEFQSVVGVAATGVNPGCVDLSTLGLKYNGQDIFKAESAGEIKHYYRNHFEGDDKSYAYRYRGPNIGATGAVSGAPNIVSRDAISVTYMEQGCYMIPMGYDCANTLSGNLTENLPNYAGTTLSLSFTVAPLGRSRIASVSGLGEITGADTVAGGLGAQDYTVYILYVITSLFSGNRQFSDVHM